MMFLSLAHARKFCSRFDPYDRSSDAYTQCGFTNIYVFFSEKGHEMLILTEVLSRSKIGLKKPFERF